MTYGIIHTHTDHSLKDGAQSISEMVERAKEMGVKALTITDHGTCTGWIDFLKKTQSVDIKGILGVEAYVRDEFCDTRKHLILLAKNKEGYREISEAVTESNYHVEYMKSGNKSRTFPVMDFDILKKHFGNGNVIATSACITGILSAILLQNEYICHDIEKIQKKQSKYDSLEGNEEYVNLKNKVENLQVEKAKLSEEIKALNKLSKKAFVKKEKSISRIEDPAERERATLLLQQEKQESANAKKEKTRKDTKRKTVSSYITAINKELKKIEKKSEKYYQYEEEIKNLKAGLYPEETLKEKAEQELLRYLSLFGKDFYMEIQYHGMPSEEHIYNELIKMARKYHVPLVATNDAHISSRDKVQKRAFLRSLTFLKYEPYSETDCELYLKTDEELREWLLKVYPEDAVNEAMNNIRVVCDSCHPIDLFHEKHYPLYRENGMIVKDSKRMLYDKAMEGARRKFPNGMPENYRERLKHEYYTIINMGFADYLLIVADYLNYGRLLGKTNTEEKCGYSIGPGRGSAAGSLLCYFLGITSIDPMPYDLLFERFLNPERISMPDIDADFSEEVRNACIEYVREKYGRESVSFIRTIMTQGAKASVRNAAKIVSSKKYGDKKNLYSLGDVMSKRIPTKPGITLDSVIDETTGKTVFDDLLENFPSDDARESLFMARDGEGAITNLGVHAAGVIISNENPISSYIPLVNMEKKGMATQCDMVEAESIGLLKMDFLGLKNLDVLTDALRLIKRFHGVDIDLDNLPQESEIYSEIFAKGFTNSVFQFESSGMKDTLRKFKPDCFEDIILLVALYRPGPMQYIPDVIAVKHKLKAEKYGTELLRPILGTTYGSTVYQEQVMLIFQNLAGYSLGGADLVRRAMSKKHLDEIERERGTFIHGDSSRGIKGCVANGISETVANNLFNELIEFAKYAFNKSHAAAYSLISYQTAYLKYHFPVEYMSSVMTHGNFDKTSSYIYDCQQMGIKILPIDINHSYNHFTPENGNIRYGFCMMKGMGSFGLEIEKERLKNGPFLSIPDFIRRTGSNKSVTERLILSGAFETFIGNHREAIANMVTDIIDKVKARIELESSNKPTATEELEEIDMFLRNISLRNPEDDEFHVLNLEKEYVGAYITKNPLESYKNVFKNVMTTANFQEGYHTMAGLLSNVKVTKRKSDGAPMAFCDLEDISGTVKVNVFTKYYDRLKNQLKEGQVVYVTGHTKIDTIEGIEEEYYEINATQIAPCKNIKESILISVDSPGILRNPELQEYIMRYANQEEGLPVDVFYADSGFSQHKKTRLLKTIANEIPPVKGISIEIIHS